MSEEQSGLTSEIGAGKPLHDRLIEVDALRAVAALMVLLHHLPEVEGPLRVLRPLQAIGWSGVGLFLVLSGFSIHYRISEHGEPERFRAGRFWKRRFWRLYPTYFGAVALAVICLLIVNGTVSLHGEWKTGGGAETVAILILGQVSLVAANLISVPFIAPSWSLALEVQLYAAYSLFVRHLRRIGVVRIVLFSLAVALLWRIGTELLTTSVPVGQFLPDGKATELSRVAYAQLPSRWFEWMLGLLVAEAYFGRVDLWKPMRRVEVTLVALVILGYLFRHHLGLQHLNGHAFFVSDVILDPLAGLVFAGILAWAVGLANLVPGDLADRVFEPLAFVGVFSYSLYLIHGSVIVVGQSVLPGATPNLVRIAFLTAASLAVAYVFFLLVERRFLRPGKERAAAPAPSHEEPTGEALNPERDAAAV